MSIVRRVRSSHLPLVEPASVGFRLGGDAVGRVRVLAPNLAALALAAVSIGMQPRTRLPGLMLPAAVLLATALLIGRVALPGDLWQHRLFVMADVMTMVVLLWSTGAPDSPFGVFAFAGVWTAAVHGSHRGGRPYAVLLSLGYGMAVLPGALRQDMLSEGLANIVAILAIGELSDAMVAIDPRARRVAEALSDAPVGVPDDEIRRRLGVAIGDSLPLDTVIAAGHLGLTAQEAELLGYLMLGLTNQQIADAASVSEATVKYRLTRLYRDLGVRGRAEAIRRVRSAGLDRTLEQPPAGASMSWPMLAAARALGRRP